MGFDSLKADAIPAVISGGEDNALLNHDVKEGPLGGGLTWYPSSCGSGGECLRTSLAPSPEPASGSVLTLQATSTRDKRVGIRGVITPE